MILWLLGVTKSGVKEAIGCISKRIESAIALAFSMCTLYQHPPYASAVPRHYQKTYQLFWHHLHYSGVYRIKAVHSRSHPLPFPLP
jgi:hypothetical protein